MAKEPLEYSKCAAQLRARQRLEETHGQTGRVSQSIRDLDW
jgi:hypothetical protein